MKNKVSKSIHSLFSKVIIVSVMLSLLSGCATTRMEGIAKAKGHINAMERIVDDMNLNRVNLPKYERGVFLSLVKVGGGGFTGLGWSGTIYVRDPQTKKFGPPSFVSAAGLAVGFMAGELYFCGSKDELHEKMYNEKSVVKILSGKVKIPDELKADIEKLNEFMERHCNPWESSGERPINVAAFLSPSKLEERVL